MAPLTVDVSAVPLALASCSIGLAHHTLPQKIEAIAQVGFQAIELSFPDILSHGRELQRLGHLSLPADGAEIQDDDYPTLAKVAEHIKHLCASQGLTILVLQPFSNFEGWDAQTRAKERQAVFDKARGWLHIMDAAGTDMLQVGSTDTPAHKLARASAGSDNNNNNDDDDVVTTNKAALAADLAELADLLRAHNPNYRIGYENWCWATHAPHWRDVWDIVRLADRPNIGLCLDTFQSAGGEWGDPTTASGFLGDASAPPTDAWKASLRALAQTVPADKIYFFQISDAYKMDPPLAPHPEPGDDSGLRPRGRWSHDYRPLPYDGGYLPIADFTRAVLETGFRGWFSVEVFDGQFESKYGQDLNKFARQAKASTQQLIKEAAAMTSL